MGVILPGVERDFPPVFSWDWDGKKFKFVMHFWKQEMNPWSNEKPVLKDLLLVIIWVAHIF